MSLPVHIVGGPYEPHKRKPVNTIQSYSGQIVPILVAPMNADGRIGKHLDLEKEMKKEELPQYWNWRERSEHITRPRDQELCGACWAFALSTVLSDKFAAEGMLDGFNPDLSATYILRCYPQQGCKGGNPALAAKMLVNQGIKTQNCVGYGWCANNDYCVGNKTYPEGTGYELGDYLNELAKVGTCECDDEFDNRLYFAKDLKYIVMNPDPKKPDENAISAEDLQQTVRYHIWQHGPVVALMHVFDNFMTGNFEKTNNIYFDTEVYPYFNGDLSDPNQFHGDHAISIIGWGSDLINGKEVPYWVCRNTWGEDWGKGGLWKHAMYPHNNKASFERAIVVNKTDLSGGIILFKAKGFEDPIDSPILGEAKKTKQWRIFLFVILGIIFMILLLAVLLFFRYHLF